MACQQVGRKRRLSGSRQMLSIEQIEVLFPRLKTSPDNGFRNIMAALPNTLGNPCNRSLRAIELQEDQLHSVAIVSPAWNHPSIAATGQGRFKTETDPSSSIASNFGKHQAAGLEGCRVGPEWRQARGDQIGVDENRTIRLLQQVFTGKRRFPAPFGSAMIRIRCPSSAMPSLQGELCS